MSYSMKIDLPIPTHHYPPEDKKIIRLPVYTQVFIRKSNKQKNRMDESKTKESILVFYSHNITIV